MLGGVDHTAAALVGRADEQRRLILLLDRVSERGHALVLRGDPGIGKSRLLAEAGQRARERGMTVLSVAGVLSEADLPFGGCTSCCVPCGRGPVGCRRCSARRWPPRSA